VKLTPRILPALLAALALQTSPLHAQSAARVDASDDARDARNEALLATPNAATPAPLSNLYATAPGLEQQAPAQNWRLNFLGPFGYDGNAEQLRSGGTSTPETSPLGSVSWAAPVADLPLRASMTANAESDRFFRASGVDRDKLGGSGRLQYIDPANDQAFSPYFAFAPRWDFLPTYANQISARQDFNLGVNKRFNFDGAFRPLAAAANTSEATVWSFGLTAFVQQRLREPQTSSTAAFLIPSVTYAISKEWNASLAVEALSRWFERNTLGFSRQDREVTPIVTLEYIVPAEALGGERNAALLGRPALDFQSSWLKVWSSAPGAGYEQFEARAAIKMGWRF
jgi:hypothetical protein